MTQHDTVGMAIRLERTRQGVSQAELAERANLSAPALSHIETGKAEPKEGTIRRLADALGVDAGELMSG